MIDQVLGKMEPFDYESGPIWGLGVIRTKSLQLLKFERMFKICRNKKGKLLEIGCGGGRFLETIRRYNPNLRLYGCDVNRKIIESNRNSNKNIYYRWGDVLKLPYKDNSFDFVIGIDILEHVESLDEALNEIKRVLKKNGSLFFSIPTEKNPLCLWNILIKLGRDIKKEYIGHVQRLTYRDVINLSKRHGFRIKRKEHNTFIIGQIFDIIYYSMWGFNNLGDNLRDVNKDEQIRGDEGVFKKFLFSLKNLIGFINYYESKLFYKMAPLSNSIDITLTYPGEKN